MLLVFLPSNKEEISRRYVYLWFFSYPSYTHFPLLADVLNWQHSQRVIASPVDEPLVRDGKFEVWESAQDEYGRKSTGDDQFHLISLNLKWKGQILIVGAILFISIFILSEFNLFRRIKLFVYLYSNWLTRSRKTLRSRYLGDRCISSGWYHSDCATHRYAWCGLWYQLSWDVYPDDLLILGPYFQTHWSTWFS